MTATPHLYASDLPEHVRAPAVTYVSVLGSGAPGTDVFYRKMSLIADIARHVSNGAKPVIEVQYWYPGTLASVEIADFYSVNPIPSLLYRVLAVVPDRTTPDELAGARADAASSSDRGDVIELHTAAQHNVVQVMHHGPFAEELTTLDRLGSFAADRGLHRSGPHHELHLDGFTRDTPQDDLRTILRDPVT